ncbi:MAG: hypothetical protein ALECFALPRED_005206 [Alectoria fallacina]|uniref:Arp2/3 complex 34 kDa subunit n=1 Tax=Alectoria fallacina TaxID=1903189 RepID=A0A8H3ENY3_9LECA|nr:MAG: hypothetical protein ALECFALPRED_005206 [Alectoria fallacina]
MLLLDYQNVLIQSLLTERFSGAPPVSIDQVVSDFDNVAFHVSTPETKSKILISIAVKCYKELLQYGAQEILEREYGTYIVSPEAGYDFSVLIDLDNLPSDQEAREDLIRRASLLKRNAMAAPFERAFDDFAQRQEEASKFTSESAPEGVREGGEVMAIHYRDEEAIYIKASHDRVTVIFSTIFREETDRVFGKVFLQEFVDARRRAIQNAPQVLFRNEPPLELQGVRGLANGTNGEYYSPGISRLNGGKKPSPISRLSETTSIITLKPQRLTSTRGCDDGQRISSRAILNRARPENEEKERKTASGRTFRVQG